jgi:ribosomal protein S27AE
MSDQPASPEEPEKKWWRHEAAAEQEAAPLPRQGEPCPKCYMAEMSYDSLFRLHCPVCGYVAACGAFT